MRDYYEDAICNYMDVFDVSYKKAKKEIDNNVKIYGMDYIYYYANKKWDD